jgi:plastocyanin
MEAFQMRSAFSGAGFALGAAIVMWSCGGGSTPSTTPSPTPTPATPTPSTVTVSIVGSAGNTAYRPNPVMANTGDQLLFKNNDTTMHHIVLDDGSADLGDLNPGASSRALTVRSGTVSYNFHCTIHSSMVGSINGANAPEPPPCPDPYYC